MIKYLVLSAKSILKKNLRIKNRSGVRCNSEVSSKINQQIYTIKNETKGKQKVK